jgi:hypothetical protein
MLRALATGAHLSFPNAQSVEDVLPQLIPLQFVTVSTKGVLSSSQLCIAARLIVCKEAIVAVNAASFSEAISYELSCVRRAHDLPGFFMMPGLRQTLPFRAGRL